MSRVHSCRTVRALRTLPIAIVMALVAIAFVGIFAPVASASPAVPHFSSNVQVDQPPAYQANQPSVKIGSDGVVYLAFSAWGGSASGTDVFFTKSRDGGRTWTIPIRVNDFTGLATQSEPSLALDSRNDIYIVWTDTRGGTNDIYFSKSVDGGGSFSANVLVNDVTTASQQEPDVAVDSSVSPAIVYAAWTDYRNGAFNPDIYFANSTDGGVSFNPNSRVNNDPGSVDQGAPAIAIAPDHSVNLVWRDSRNAAKGSDIYFVKSVDRGSTWTPNPQVPVNHDSGNANQAEPTIAVNETNTIFVSWTDSRNGDANRDIFATRSTNGGSTFAVEVRVNDDLGAIQQIQPTIATRAGKVQVAWTDYRTGGSLPYAIYTASSSDGLTWSANVKVNGDTGRNIESMPSVAVDGSGDVVVAWLDQQVTGQGILAATLDVIAPTAAAGPAVSIDQGASAALNGSGSTDNLGIASYSWDYGDGSTGSGSMGTHVYPNAGTYTATLTVVDYSGNSATASAMVTVHDTTAPIALGGGDRSADEGQSLFFDASASRDNVGVIGYAWNFGDGSSASTATANHVYAHPGVYHATLTVTDAAGNTAISNFDVTVRAVSPKASDLLGMIEILAGVIAALAIAVILLGWMALARRKRDDKPAGMAPYEPPAQTPPPPRDSDPLDMTFPPTPPQRP